MEKCRVPGCMYYNGSSEKNLCKFHVQKYSITFIRKIELTKLKGVGVPIHDRRTNKLKF